ncbi:hypothetical protein [Aliarcobacter butzleri]|uniref:hypothetical protein n=1 Tax=Aliarcobacter butzleri TaxID=28197 RepID=UPI0021B1E143|nr:hypothetical protein [Aliarcobacter butzleri]MCT7595259.1 hypothetical protein [Aliarcobacter butzleri]MCT7599503.1 hypothetical protein [Aliarcobacter butzleri]
MVLYGRFYTILICSGLTYQNIELFGKVQNIFDRKNGLWVANNWGSSDTVYPINFETTFFAGMKVNF